MDYTFLVINLKNEIDIEKLNDFLQQKFFDFELIVATYKKQNKFSTTLKEYLFDEKDNSDKILNTLIPLCHGSRIIIIRQLDKDDFSLIEKIVKPLRNENQIVVVGKKHNKFIDFFKKIFNKIISLFFGYKLINSYLGITAYGETATNVLKQTPVSSLFTKIDKWANIEVIEIEGNDKKAKFDKNLTKNIVKLSICCTILILGIVLWAVFASKMNRIFYHLIALTIIIFSLALGVIESLLLTIKCKIGEVERNSAQIIKDTNITNVNQAQPQKIKEGKKENN